MNIDNYTLEHVTHNPTSGYSGSKTFSITTTEDFILDNSTYYAYFKNPKTYYQLYLPTYITTNKSTTSICMKLDIGSQTIIEQQLNTLDGTTFNIDILKNMSNPIRIGLLYYHPVSINFTSNSNDECDIQLHGNIYNIVHLPTTNIPEFVCDTVNNRQFKYIRGMGGFTW